MRGRYPPAPSTPPHASQGTPVKEEPIPLPLPKNVVLMEMIESVERQARLLEEAKNGAGESSTRLDPTLTTASAYSSCGTYKVKERSGLAVLPFDPNSQGNKKKQADEEKKAEEAREPLRVEEGQTVQVVSIDQGVYKLARGSGFIVATVNQLVRVGAAIEKSCQLEGLLQCVETKQRKLQRELDGITRFAEGLREEIEKAQGQQEGYPVISAPKERLRTPEVNDENDATTGVRKPKTPPSRQLGLRFDDATESVPEGPGHDRAAAHQNATNFINSPAHSCPESEPAGFDKPYMDNRSAGLPRYRMNSADDDLHGLFWTFDCGSALFGERLIGNDTERVVFDGFDDSSLVDDRRNEGMPSRQAITPTGTSSGAQTHADFPLRRGGSFDGVNFRTGMSGHRGLTQARTNPKTTARPQIRMMSEHRGVARVLGSGAGNGVALRRRTTPHDTQGEF